VSESKRNNPESFVREQARSAMNILVTGGAGYIGSHACKALAAKGHRRSATTIFRVVTAGSVGHGTAEAGPRRTGAYGAA
jgi:NADPH:quinone reductase-like Zn-dependent oxidoreductase